jgi:hypothetical protein
MKYFIEWKPVAEQDLARIWLAAMDRNAVTAASAVLEQNLLFRPLTYGESRRSSVHRVAFHAPLGIEYEVVEDDKKVIVQGVWAVW